jgi:predicted TIM-barrel fold metal-dependent hydrolase
MNLIIDGHIHAGYWSPERFVGRGVPLAELETCLVECGIDGAVLTSTDLRRNDLVLEFIGKERQRRYWFFPWVNPADGSDLDFARHHRADIHGIKLHPSCDRIKVTDKKVEPLLNFARAESLPVMIHCGRWQEMSSYRLALEVAARYPDLNVILSHMGGDTPELEMATIDAIKGRDLHNAYLGIEGVREYWAVQKAVEEIGAERVIFGSDFPLGHPKIYLGLVDALRMSADDRELVLSGNILRLLGEVK